MSLNCNEINKILSELKLEGSFVQDIIQPGFDSLALKIYGKNGAQTLFICTAQNSCRFHITNKKISKNEKPLRFMEFLKSKIKGAKIISCKQLGLQRVIKMELIHGNENYILYIRLWSNAANVILCNSDNTILDSMFRRPKKGEITGGIFVPPSDNNDENNEKWLIREFSEVQGNSNCNLEDKKELSFNEKVDLWYSEHSSTLSRQSLLEQAEKWYQSSKSRLENALENLKNKRESFIHSAKLKHYGDLILSNAALFDGKSHFLECEDYENSKTIRISVEPKKSAQENAARYYEDYKKAQTGAESLKHDIDLLEKKLNKLALMYHEIIETQNPVKIEQLIRMHSTPKQKIKKTHPGLDYNVNGWYILVGRNADENDELLRHHVKGSDMWLHVRDFAGGYVFIKHRAGKTIPLEILLDAANLAVYYSKARNAGKTDLYYTNVKYLKRAKNAPKGTVLPTREKNLCIEPDKKRLERLDSIRQEAEF